jgi:hypothetical protein
MDLRGNIEIDLESGIGTDHLAKFGVTTRAELMKLGPSVTAPSAAESTNAPS